jgi:hypothetical protein
VDAPRRPPPRPAARAARSAGLAAARVGGVLALFSVVRCSLDLGAGLSASAPFWAGGVAVAVPYALQQSRADAFSDIVRDTFRVRAFGRAGSVAAAFLSGSVVLGGGHSLLSSVGLGW